MVKVNGVNGLEKVRVWKNATVWNAKARATRWLIRTGIVKEKKNTIPAIIEEVIVN